MLQLFSFPFSAMASACAMHLYADDRVGAEAIAEAAMTEVARIEQRYSRYRADSVITEINDVAQRAGSIAVDDETAKLLDYAYACHQRSDGLFDITSGILRRIWDFKPGHLPDRKVIDDLLPRIGLAKVSWERPRLTRARRRYCCNRPSSKSQPVEYWHQASEKSRVQHRVRFDRSRRTDQQRRLRTLHDRRRSALLPHPQSSHRLALQRSRGRK